MKKHITNTKEFLGEKIEVFKKDFEIYQYSSEYYSICLKNSHGGSIVWGGDSADVDSYEKKLINTIFKNWDGKLEWTGDKYGYQIAL